MTDPYNTASDIQHPARQPVSTPGPARPPALPVRQARPAPAESPGTFYLWNILAIIVVFAFVAFNDATSLKVLLMCIGPLVLAFISGAWVTNPVFCKVVRGINSLVALLILLRMSHYFLHGIFRVNVLMVLIVLGLMPALNAIFLKPHNAVDR